VSRNIRLELGKDFAEKFLEICGEHKWPPLRETISSYEPRIWMDEMFKILDKVAGKMKLKSKANEMLRIDRAYYKGEAHCPIVAVEHENISKRDWESRIRRLLAVDARLRVLICYLPEREQFVLPRRIKAMLSAEMHAGRFNDEFLLILGKDCTYSIDRKAFSIYWYFSGVYEKKLSHGPLPE
jgi:hypothetical protein